MFNIIYNVLTQQGFKNTIVSYVLIIGIGLILGYKNILSKDSSKVFGVLLLDISMPALIFTSFFTDIDINNIRQSINILVWGFIMYMMLIFLCKLIYIKYEGNKKNVLALATMFGSTTLFGIPIINALYGSEGVIYANLFNISYRIFLYTYAFIRMSELQVRLENFKQIFLNPIIITTFLGLMIWILQEYVPKTLINDQYVSIVRIDKIFPELFYSIKLLANLASPLAWLSIGVTLSSLSLKETLFSKDVWYYSFNKVVLLSLLNLIILTILNVFGLLKLSFTALASIVILMSTPTAPIIVMYSLKYKKEIELVSLISLLSTIACIVFIPIWIIVLEFVKNFIYK